MRRHHGSRAKRSRSMPNTCPHSMQLTTARHQVRSLHVLFQHMATRYNTLPFVFGKHFLPAICFPFSTSWAPFAALKATPRVDRPCALKIAGQTKVRKLQPWKVEGTAALCGSPRWTGIAPCACSQCPRPCAWLKAASDQTSKEVHRWHR